MIPLPIFIHSTSFGWIYSNFLMGTDLAEIESDFSTVKRQGRIEIQDHAIYGCHQRPLLSFFGNQTTLLIIIF